MTSDLEAFREDLLNRAVARASVDGIFTADAFMAEAAELLIAAEEVGNLDLLSFVGTGRLRQALSVHGSDFDEQDTSVTLVVLRYVGGPAASTISYSEAATSLRSLQNYLEEALSGDFLVDREPASPEYQLAQTLRERWGRRGEFAISRFRLFLITDAVLSSRAKSMESSTIGGATAEFHIWDMQRFLQVHQSSQGRESLELDLKTWGVDRLPALRIEDKVGEITTYLAAVPGSLLASLYRHHGSRLLEGNVRSFLTIRGKINRGIRETVMKDPGLFLAYNNGISATATAVEYVDGAITSITDLQIVNGGQTTASLFYATQASRAVSLDDVFVQMKLVIVAPEAALEMVPLISRYANSQNAVREDDFFSNSPFHVRMEEISKRLLAPAKAGINYQTKWYYERTRGQYLNEKNRRSLGDQRKFEAEFPKPQVITKTDAAKYVVSWERAPHQVSAGAQKNFKAFASIVAEHFGKQPEAYNENYYRRLVAKAILFNSVRTAISKADWYEAGYLANLTSYALAKLSLEISRDPRAKSFDLMRIWEGQAVSDAVLAEAVDIARLALDVLTSEDRLVVNVTEWAKREAAWKRLAAVEHRLSDAFIRDSLPVRKNASGERALTVSDRFDPAISERRHVQDVGEAGWRAVQSFLSSANLLTSVDRQILRHVVPTSPRMLELDVARELLRLYVKALNHGFDD
ncbi:AIPR family protein [Nocardioides sp.]|uniref:AIPR family protein n=1 Tax=Nocardioides sp. TaxID=35761 RepID=UPI00351394EE